MLAKNRLKDLIYIQENKPCSEQSIKGLFRSIVEPVLEHNLECLVLCRFEEKSKEEFSSILQRLEYSNATIYDYSKIPVGGKFEHVLKEDIWNNTEFVYVLSERYGGVLLFDYEESDIDNFAQFYILHNSKNLSESFEVINSNSTVDLRKYEDDWRPDRRDNGVLNSSIRKIIENLNETSQEMLISQMEQEPKTDSSEIESRLNFLLAKSSYIVHEMRNLFSICNLYSTIIDKQDNKVKFEDETTAKSITNARDCIKKSLQMSSNLLLDFKSLRNNDLKSNDLKKLIVSSMGLAKVYANGKNIKFGVKNLEPVTVLVDENKFTTVLINLIKNAVESYEDAADKQGKIVIETKIEDDNVKIIVSNNGRPINKELQSKIFEEGFTTKTTGTGLGLAICKKTLEEQFAQLKLKKSDEVSTEFEITILKSK